MFTLKIETGNAAFENPQEVARILKNLAHDAASELRDMADRGALRDANGNTVGTWRYVPEVVE